MNLYKVSDTLEINLDQVTQITKVEIETNPKPIEPARLSSMYINRNLSSLYSEAMAKYQKAIGSWESKVVTKYRVSLSCGNSIDLDEHPVTREEYVN